MGISTDENQMSSTDEERLSNSFGDNILLHSDSLTFHQIPNTGDGQFSCIQCNRAFSKSGRLKKHKLVHTGEKQFVCDQRDKAISECEEEANEFINLAKYGSNN